MVHIDFGRRLDVLVPHDCLGILHGSVLLEVGAQRAAEYLERAELPRNIELVGDRPNFPLEEILRTKRHRLALGRKHQRVGRSVWTNLAPGFDVWANTQRYWNPCAAVFCLDLALI